MMAVVEFVSGKGNNITVDFPKVKNPRIVSGSWVNPNTGASIQEIDYGEKVKFIIETEGIDDGTSLDLTLYDYDGAFNMDDKLSRYTSVVVNGNKAELELIPDSKWEKSAQYEADKVVETYFEIKFEIDRKELTAEMPLKEDDYLKIYPKEVKITVIVELPHSLETGWGAKGLAGHTAMAIGDRYFDYGPNNSPGTYSESDYGVDFNDDGDMVDDVNLTDPSFENAPGMPWWGAHIAQSKGIKPEDVTLDMALKHIALHWSGTAIYGKVHTVEFYVLEEHADKMLDWWENRYDKLEIYSVYPWTGEQCTTTVKTALQEGGIPIPDVTQKPVGILSDFKNLVLNSSVKHRGEKATITVIKPESSDWKP